MQKPACGLPGEPYCRGQGFAYFLTTRFLSPLQPQFTGFDAFFFS